jgi:cation-dependent mannose-6-phosphate receptor
MIFHHTALAILLGCQAFAALVTAASDDTTKKEPPPKPCTIRSLSTGNFFDLNQLYVEPPKKDSKASSDAKKVESWHVKGYDSGVNFTMNICGPVVEELDDVVGVTTSMTKNVSAFYTKGKDTYSIG